MKVRRGITAHYLLVHYLLVLPVPVLCYCWCWRLLLTAIQLTNAVCCVDTKGINYGRHVGSHRGS